MVSNTGKTACVCVFVIDSSRTIYDTKEEANQSVWRQGN